MACSHNAAKTNKLPEKRGTATGKVSSPWCGEFGVALNSPGCRFQRARGRVGSTRRARRRSLAQTCRRLRPQGRLWCTRRPHPIVPAAGKWCHPSSGIDTFCTSFPGRCATSPAHRSSRARPRRLCVAAALRASSCSANLGAVTLPMAAAAWSDEATSGNPPFDARATAPLQKSATTATSSRRHGWKSAMPPGGPDRTGRPNPVLHAEPSDQDCLQAQPLYVVLDRFAFPGCGQAAGGERSEP